MFMIVKKIALSPSDSPEREAHTDTSAGMGQARDTRVHVTLCCAKLDNLTSVLPQHSYAVDKEREGKKRTLQVFG